MSEHGATAQLAMVCAELNFVHSLLLDAVDLRARALRALTRSVTVLEDAATAMDRMEAAATDERRRRRLAVRASVVRRAAEAGRRRSVAVGAIALDAPRHDSMSPDPASISKPHTER